MSTQTCIKTIFVFGLRERKKGFYQFLFSCYSNVCRNIDLDISTDVSLVGALSSVPIKMQQCQDLAWPLRTVTRADPDKSQAFLKAKTAHSSTNLTLLNDT